MTLLGVVVVRVDLGAKLHFLDDGVRLIATRLALLHGGFVLELAEIHELAHRRLGHRGNLDQVEICLHGQSKRIFDAHDADLLAVGSDKPDFWDANAVVDSWFDADGASLFVRSVAAQLCGAIRAKG